MPFPALYPTPVTGITNLPPGPGQAAAAMHSSQYGPMLTYIMPPALLARAISAQGGGASEHSQPPPRTPPPVSHPYSQLHLTASAIKAQAQADAALMAARGAGGLQDGDLPLGRFRLPGLAQILADSSEFDFDGGGRLSMEADGAQGGLVRALASGRDIAGRAWGGGLERGRDQLHQAGPDLTSSLWGGAVQGQQGLTDSFRTTNLAGVLPPRQGGLTQTHQHQESSVSVHVRSVSSDSGSIIAGGENLALDRDHERPLANQDAALNSAGTSPLPLPGASELLEGNDRSGSSSSSLASSLEGVQRIVALRSDTSSSVRSSASRADSNQNAALPQQATAIQQPSSQGPQTPVFGQDQLEVSSHPLLPLSTEQLSPKVTNSGSLYQQHAAQSATEGGRGCPNDPPTPQRLIPQEPPRQADNDAAPPVSRSWREFMPRPSPPPASQPSPSRYVGLPTSLTTAAMPSLPELPSSDTADQGYQSVTRFQGAPLHHYPAGMTHD